MSVVVCCRAPVNDFWPGMTPAGTPAMANITQSCCNSALVHALIISFYSGLPLFYGRYSHPLPPSLDPGMRPSLVSMAASPVLCMSFILAARLPFSRPLNSDEFYKRILWVFHSGRPSLVRSTKEYTVLYLWSSVVVVSSPAVCRWMVRCRVKIGYVYSQQVGR